MKLLLATLFFIYQLSAFAQIAEQRDLAIISSIDTIEIPLNYVVSEEALPEELYKQLMTQISLFQFTLMEETEVQDLFEKLEMDSKARMKNPGGRCAERRYYIQNLLKKMKIVSGQLLINCPKNDGRLRLKDQVSGHNYSFSNFHDTNIVAINTNSGVEFRVLDLQFEDIPVSLHEYFSEVESLQKIRPSKTKGPESGKGICYWSISTDYLTFKHVLMQKHL
ncbi:MAG TPA: hypothetical protein VNJ08_06975 [Bacteriovoracaceae bacterium]|nr:hypothetical protein [Bacteriovoracaceae bacterium]